MIKSINTFLSLITVTVIFTASSCSQGNLSHTASPNTSANDSAREVFLQFSDQFLDSLWFHYPEWATSIGYHKYDSLLPIPDEAQIQTQLYFIRSWKSRLTTFNPNTLDDENRISYEMIKNMLEMKEWELVSLKEYEWNPSLYNVSGTISYMLSEPYAPLEERLMNSYKRIKSIPEYYKAAKLRVKNPVEELKILAIDQCKGGLTVFSKDYIDSVKRSKLPQADQTEMIHAAQTAIQSVNDYVSFLQKIREDGRSFRLGKELYEEKFRFYIESEYTAGQMYATAIERKNYIHAEMVKLSRSLWPKYFGKATPPDDSLALVRMVIDTLSAAHVKPEAFQTAIEKQLPELVQFVNEKNLLYLDPSKPLVVRKEPAYMAGLAGASISAPGPYDKDGNTYYNVGSLEGWSSEKAESYLREYNNYTLQILNIHEAIPGHYTQLVYANRNPSIVKSVFANNATIEGWAVYAEQMMLENGYGNNTPEMWLMWYKWHLRTVCNMILDYEVHANNLSREAAMDLLIRQAFQQQAEADGKWRRVSISSIQLTSYYSGYKAIYDLRTKIKEKEEKHFDLRVFHEKFLSFGNTPVKYISSVMLQK